MASSNQANTEPTTENSSDSTLMARRGRTGGARGSSPNNRGGNTNTNTTNINIRGGREKPGWLMGTTHAYRCMSSDGQTQHKDLKSRLRVAASGGKRQETKSILEQLQKLYKTEAALTSDARGKADLLGASEDCAAAAKLVEDPTFNLGRIVEKIDDLTVQNSTDGNSTSTSTQGGSTAKNTDVAKTEQYDAVLAIYTDSNGKIKDVSKMNGDLDEQGFKISQREGIIDRYYERQGVPASERPSRVAEAMDDKINQSSNDTTLASAKKGNDNGTNRQM